MARSRAEREAAFRAEHGVSSGTYYEMRRKAASAAPGGPGYKGQGISGKTFDAIARESGYNKAKEIAQQARTDLEGARFQALIHAGAPVPAGMAFSDFDSSMDYDWIPDDFDWYYH